MTLTVTEAGLSLADPAAYTDEDRLHEALTLLRREAPVHRVEADGYDPFWASPGSVELMGRPEWVATTFVGGLKRLPIRYTLKG
jgi:hypothetical protein